MIIACAAVTWKGAIYLRAGMNPDCLVVEGDPGELSAPQGQVCDP